MPDQPGTIYSIITDPEVTQTGISVFGRCPLATNRRSAPTRRLMAERLFSGMLSDRLDEIAQQPNAPFLAAQTSRGIFVHRTEVTSLNALVAQGASSAGSRRCSPRSTAWRGFVSPRPSSIVGARSAAGAGERDGREEQEPVRPAGRRVHQELSAGRTDSGHRAEFALNQRFLPEITLAEINALAKEWAPDRNRVVAIIAPEKDKATLPDAPHDVGHRRGERQTAGGACRHGEHAATARAAPVAWAASRPLPTMPRLASPSGRLSNGVRVVLKPTTFKEDEILFRAVSPGGTSLAPDRDFIAAETADAVVRKAAWQAPQPRRQQGARRPHRVGEG